MRIHRRRALAAGLAGGAAAAAIPFSAFGQSDAGNPNYARLDAVLREPVFTRELFAEPVIIESVELLRDGRSFLCRVRSKDGAEGISVAHDTMNVLYPIFVNRLQPIFIDQDARRLDDLLEKALEYSFNFRFGGMAIGIPCHHRVCHSRHDGTHCRKARGQLIGEIHTRISPVYQATEWREKSVEESVGLIRGSGEKSRPRPLKIKVGGLMLHDKDWMREARPGEPGHSR